MNDRVSIKNPEDYAFQPNIKLGDNEPTKNNLFHPETTVVVGYTMYGKTKSFDSDGNPIVEGPPEDTNLDMFAKSVTKGSTLNYYVRTNSHGHIFNPLSMDSIRLHKSQAHTGKIEFRFHKVDKNVFNSYMMFLRTKNVLYLHRAEKEIV